ncbi:MAG: PQQ-binding-like beta-propeller repeat protein, partial [Acidimicrobiia bacterium]|nr:PQQ-binding-like beta-propeller repeat protein [Acidimicrobiia bacterium]
MRRVTRTAMVLTAVVVLGGCWLQPGADARRSGFAPLKDGLDIQNVAQLHEQWTRQLGGTVKAPVVGPDGVYAVSGDFVVSGKLTAIDPGGGATRWSATLWDANIPYWPNAPTILDGKVHVPMLGGSTVLPSTVKRFDAASGAPLPSLANGATTTVIGRDGTLVGTVALQVPPCCTAVSRFFVESTNGGGSWVSYLYIGGVASLPVPTSAAVGTARFFIGQGSALEAYPLTKPGNCTSQYSTDFCPPIWSVPLRSSVAGNPVLSEDETTVYAAAGDKLVARYAADGTPRWTGTLGAPASAAPALANGYVFVPTNSGELDVFTTGCGKP